MDSNSERRDWCWLVRSKQAREQSSSDVCGLGAKAAATWRTCASLASGFLQLPSAMTEGSVSGSREVDTDDRRRASSKVRYGRQALKYLKRGMIGLPPRLPLLHAGHGPCVKTNPERDGLRHIP